MDTLYISANARITDKEYEQNGQGGTATYISWERLLNSDEFKKLIGLRDASVQINGRASTVTETIRGITVDKNGIKLYLDLVHKNTNV